MNKRGKTRAKTAMGRRTRARRARRTRRNKKYSRGDKDKEARREHK